MAKTQTWKKGKQLSLLMTIRFSLVFLFWLPVAIIFANFVLLHSKSCKRMIGRHSALLCVVKQNEWLFKREKT